MKTLKKYIDSLVADRSIEHAFVRVGRGADVMFDLSVSADEHTLFDMASVTKIVATTSLALVAIDRGLISPCDSVGKFFALPDDKRTLNVGHLLTHTWGIGHKSLLPSTLPYERIEEFILSIPSDVAIGSEVRYSCPGYILLGRILEEVFGDRLDRIFYREVATPLGMSESRFLPDRSLDIVNANLSEEDRGAVNDYNCRFLGGVAGNAGLFSNVTDMTRYVKMLLSNGSPIISNDTFRRATENYTEAMRESRGLGFVYVDRRYFQAAPLFPDGSFGHCGHTGQSVFVDPTSGLYVIVLSDATCCSAKKHGKEVYSEVKEMRARLHGAIKEDVESMIK